MDILDPPLNLERLNCSKKRTNGEVSFERKLDSSQFIHNRKNVKFHSIYFWEQEKVVIDHVEWVRVAASWVLLPSGMSALFCPMRSCLASSISLSVAEGSSGVHLPISKLGNWVTFQLVSLLMKGVHGPCTLGLSVCQLFLNLTISTPDLVLKCSIQWHIWSCGSMCIRCSTVFPFTTKKIINTNLGKVAFPEF